MYLYHRCRDEIYEFFTDAARNEAKEDGQDSEKGRVTCTTNQYIEKKEEEDEVSFEEVKKFLDKYKKKIEEVK